MKASTIYRSIFYTKKSCAKPSELRSGAGASGPCAYPGGDPAGGAAEAQWLVTISHGGTVGRLDGG